MTTAVSGFGIWAHGFPGPLFVAMAAPPGAPNPLIQLVPFALVAVIIYFVILRPMKRQQKKIQEFLTELKVGDRVVTSGGLYGTITRVEEKTLQLQIADKVRVELARSAVVGYQGQDPVSPETTGR